MSTDTDPDLEHANRFLDDGDLVTTSEFARVAGLRRETVASYVSKGRIPKPDGHLERTPYWYGATVKAWIADRRPPGRPRKDAQE